MNHAKYIVIMSKIVVALFCVQGVEVIAGYVASYLSHSFQAIKVLNGLMYIAVNSKSTQAIV